MRAHGMHARAMRAWDILRVCVDRRTYELVTVEL